MLGTNSRTGSLEFLSSTRQVLLVAIKNQGEATTEQLARETYLSAGAVRQHLLSLEAQGLVTYVKLREGPGRPRHVFRLTTQGEDLFPQQYAQVANIFLAALEAEDPSLKERVFERLVGIQTEQALERVSAKSRAERLLQVHQLIERHGYFPELEVLDNGPAKLTLRHCPLLNIARNHPEICEAESRAIVNVLPGSTVCRSAHRLEGEAVCVYEIDYAAAEGKT
ncbi:MAG TPA: ArsR family transcriptional regulator [Tepidiformaceae bacterium]|nr:ArsR family transcriptional regulator [Tepidiformaceae bacterium]HMO95865.1 ArsR family transcriptional regulator [Tepidiformaceae bacterium]